MLEIMCEYCAQLFTFKKKWENFVQRLRTQTHANLGANDVLLTIGLPSALNDSFGGFNRVNILYVSKFLANERPRNSTANSNFFSAIALATA